MDLTKAKQPKPCCPRCGCDLEGKVISSIRLQTEGFEDPILPIKWNPNSRVLTWGSESIRFSNFRGNIVDCIWRSSQKNVQATITEVVEAAYHGSYDGGPEEAEKSVAVTLAKIRSQLRAIGLDITLHKFKFKLFGGTEEDRRESAERARKYNAYDRSRYVKKSQEESAVAAMYRPPSNRTMMGNAE